MVSCVPFPLVQFVETLQQGRATGLNSLPPGTHSRPKKATRSVKPKTLSSNAKHLKGKAVKIQPTLTTRMRLRRHAPGLGTYLLHAFSLKRAPESTWTLLWIWVSVER